MTATFSNAWVWLSSRDGAVREGAPGFGPAGVFSIGPEETDFVAIEIHGAPAPGTALGADRIDGVEEVKRNLQSLARPRPGAGFSLLRSRNCSK